MLIILRFRPTFTYGRPDCMHIAHPVGVALHNAALQRGGGLVALDEYLEAHAGAEEAAFAVWLDGVYSRWQRAQLNHFEHNIQVWMQLWHTIASCTVVCLVADARNPIWHIPPSLVNEVVSVMKKPLLIALSKCDLVPEGNIRAWTQALRERFPSAAAIVPFSATGLLLGGVRSIAQRRRELKDVRVKKSPECLKRVADSVTRLLAAAGGHASSIALAAKRVMVVGGAELGEGEDGDGVDDDDGDDDEEGEGGDVEDEDSAPLPPPHSALHAHLNTMCVTKAQQRKARKDKRKEKQKRRVPVAVTLVEEEMERLGAALQEKGEQEVVIGMIGHPNAGKSSIINAMCSKKVVSVSRCARVEQRDYCVCLNMQRHRCIPPFTMQIFTILRPHDDDDDDDHDDAYAGDHDYDYGSCDANEGVEVDCCCGGCDDYDNYGIGDDDAACRTAGHTKRAQTVRVAPAISVLDCPGTSHVTAVTLQLLHSQLLSCSFKRVAQVSFFPRFFRPSKNCRRASALKLNGNAACKSWAA